MAAYTELKYGLRAQMIPASERHRGMPDRFIIVTSDGLVLGVVERPQTRPSVTARVSSHSSITSSWVRNTK